MTRLINAYWRTRQFFRELFCKHEWNHISFSFIAYSECAKCHKREEY